MIRWSPEAVARLEAIESHVERDNPSAAIRLVGRLIERAEQLAEHPRLGRPVAEARDEALREVVEGNYRIVYRVIGQPAVVELVTIFEAHLPSELAPRSRRRSRRP